MITSDAARPGPESGLVMNYIWRDSEIAGSKADQYNYLQIELEFPCVVDGHQCGSKGLGATVPCRVGRVRKIKRAIFSCLQTKTFCGPSVQERRMGHSALVGYYVFYTR